MYGGSWEGWRDSSAFCRLSWDVKFSRWRKGGQCENNGGAGDLGRCELGGSRVHRMPRIECSWEEGSKQRGDRHREETREGRWDISVVCPLSPVREIVMGVNENQDDREKRPPCSTQRQIGGVRSQLAAIKIYSIASSSSAPNFLITPILHIAADRAIGDLYRRPPRIPDVQLHLESYQAFRMTCVCSPIEGVAFKAPRY
jgi:hypothetical protein